MLDMDSSESPTYGEQEDSAYNGHFGCTIYHPLFVFNQFGDVERCAPRPGNVHSADGWRLVLEPVIARYRATVTRLYFRGDAAFANPEIYEVLEAEQMPTRSGCRPTMPCSAGSAICRDARSGDHRMRCAGTTRASPIRRRAGASHAASWPRSSGIRASCTRVSASS